MITTRKGYGKNRAGTERRRGSVLLIVVSGMVALMGFCALAVDYGMLVADANRLQRACDAAALAGAYQLSQNKTNTSPATQAAMNVANQNEVTTVTPAQVTYLDDNTKIRVEATEQQDFFFARVLGFTSGTVTRYAIAEITGKSTPEIVPIGITGGPNSTYEKYAPGGVPKPGTDNRAVITFINHKRVNFGTDNFILFDLRSAQNNAKSPAWMQRQLEGTDIQPVRVGDGIGSPEVDFDYVDALNANSAGKFFVDGMRTRFQAAAGAPWFDIDPTRPNDIINWDGQKYDSVMAGTEPTTGAAPFARNPRIMDLIVTTPAAASAGNTNQPVLDFAPVYVEQVVATSSAVQIIVRFLPRSMGASGGKISLMSNQDSKHLPYLKQYSNSAWLLS